MADGIDANVALGYVLESPGLIADGGLTFSDAEHDMITLDMIVMEVDYVDANGVQAGEPLTPGHATYESSLTRSAETWAVETLINLDEPT